MAEYFVTLPPGTIAVRNGIYTGSQTETVWIPTNPDNMTGWEDGDTLHVVASLNIKPPVTPMPPASEYVGLCAGACNSNDTAAVQALISEARRIYTPNPGKLLGSHISESTEKSENAIFYNAQSTKGTFPLPAPPSDRGTLTNYVYRYTMTYNGDNTVVPDGNHVEIVFGYGDPMESDSQS